MKKKFFTSKVYLLLLPAGYLLSCLAQFYPAWIEKHFSQGLFMLINPVLSSITGLLPFSLAELLVVVLGLAAIISIYRMAARISRREAPVKTLLAHFLLNTLVFVSILYFSFNLLWGLNYYRQPFAALAGLEIKPATVCELEDLCRMLINQANGAHKNYLKSDDNLT